MQNSEMICNWRNPSSSYFVESNVTRKISMLAFQNSFMGGNYKKIKFPALYLLTGLFNLQALANPLYTCQLIYDPNNFIM